ncbi:hypothetical protein THAOC_05696, partial [Thalassiosira oceanica]
MGSLDKYAGDIVKLRDGSVALKLKMKVPASMRDAAYETETLSTAKDLIAASCECKSGAEDEEKVTCVHVPPVLYKVTELIHEGLGEHVVAHLPPVFEAVASSWSPDDLESVKSSMVKLIEANGDTLSLQEVQSMNAHQLLERFHTSTDREKRWGFHKDRAATKPGPIAERTFTSTVKKAKDLKNTGKNQKAAEAEPIDDSDEPPQLLDDAFKRDLEDVKAHWHGKPNYLSCLCLASAADIIPDDLASNQHTVPVSCRLLNLRANKQAETMNVTDLLAMRTAAKSSWDRMVATTKKRSRRPNAGEFSGSAEKRKRPTDEDDLDCELPRQCVSYETPKPKKKRPHSYCRIKGCGVNNVNTPRAKFHMVPSMPKPLKENATKKQYIKREEKIALRRETLDRIGRSRDDKGRYVVCDHHRFEYATKYRTLSWKNKDGSVETWSQGFKLFLPLPEGTKSTINIPTTRPSSGNARDRGVKRQLDEVNSQISASKSAESSTSPPSDSADWRMVTQQLAEKQS